MIRKAIITTTSREFPLFSEEYVDKVIYVSCFSFPPNPAIVFRENGLRCYNIMYPPNLRQCLIPIACCIISEDAEHIT